MTVDEGHGGDSRRVLVVAYFFPPLGGGGVQRTLAFVRHLPAVGWTPIVLAPRDPGYEIRDPTLVDRLPADLEVHRSRSPEPWWPIFRRAQSMLRRARGRQRAGRRGEEPESSSDRRRPAGIRWSVRLAANVFFPDDHLSWLPFAAWSGAEIVRRRRVDVVFSTSPPVTGHLVAGLVSRVTGVPWVADFRDPWIGNAFLPQLSPVHRAAQRWLERWIVSSAVAVIAATPTLAASLRARYPERAAVIHVITNGFDREELDPFRRSPEPSDRLRLVYSGSAYGGVVAPFVAGLERFATARPDLASRLSVEFVGWLDADSRHRIEALDRDASTAGIVTTVGHRPRAEALATVAGADAALYLLDDDPRKSLFVGGKLYEYIGLGVPILAVVPAGDARWVLESLDWGIVADPDPRSVCDGLIRLFEEPQASGDADPEGRFDRRRLTAELARVLDLAGRRPRVGPERQSVS